MVFTFNYGNSAFGGGVGGKENLYSVCCDPLSTLQI